MAEDKTDFSSFFTQILSPLFMKTILTYLFYGIYFVLFCICIFFHHRHGDTIRKPFQRFTLIGLFFLATTTVILDTLATMKQMWVTLGEYWGGQPSLDQVTINKMTVQLDIICGTIVFVLYVLSNFLADLILIHRNSVIWNGRRFMVWVPLCVSIFNNALGLVGIGFEASNISRYPNLSVPFNQYTNGDKLVLAYLFINASLNFGLTGCLAGRIWWIGRKTRMVLAAQKLRSKYNSAMAITLESGILYPVALIISVVVTIRRPTAPSMYPFLVQVVGIAPTLIVVRTVMGLSVEQDVEDANLEGDNNSTMLNTYTDRRDEKLTRTVISHRSSFGERFAIHSNSFSPGSFRSENQASWEASEPYASNSSLPRDVDQQSSHSRQTSGPHDDVSSVPIPPRVSQAKSHRPFRTLPVPRGARSQKSIDETTSVGRARTPPLNIMVHTSVEQSSEYAPRLRAFS